MVVKETIPEVMREVMGNVPFPEEVSLAGGEPGAVPLAEGVGKTPVGAAVTLPGEVALLGAGGASLPVPDGAGGTSVPLLDGAGGNSVGEAAMGETSVVPWSGISETVATGTPSTRTVETMGVERGADSLVGGVNV